MSTKSFKGAQKPGRRPTPEEISAFEETGRAIARERKITAKAERRDPRKAKSREHPNTENREPGNEPSRQAVNTEIQIDDSVDAREPAGTESRDAGKPETQKSVPVVRLTIDLPESIHTRFKVACALTRRKMVEEVREMIERRTAELEAEAGSPQ